MIYLRYYADRAVIEIQYRQERVYVPSTSPVTSRRALRQLTDMSTVGEAGGRVAVGIMAVAWFSEIKMMLDYPDVLPIDIENAFNDILVNLATGTRTMYTVLTSVWA